MRWDGWELGSAGEFKGPFFFSFPVVCSLFRIETQMRKVDVWEKFGATTVCKTRLHIII